MDPVIIGIIEASWTTYFTMRDPKQPFYQINPVGWDRKLYAWSDGVITWTKERA